MFQISLFDIPDLIPSIDPRLEESEKFQYYPDLVRPYPYDDDDLDEEGGGEY